ncbi:hypothetical protein PG994_006921 [Apiospora phragmitis]|uniref:Uncharacterized protein n=1 Tax=Apiospora phragmitis TaxID=2905665 RepID=A0ABR1VGI2_9PEZI
MIFAEGSPAANNGGFITLETSHILGAADWAVATGGEQRPTVVFYSTQDLSLQRHIKMQIGDAIAALGFIGTFAAPAPAPGPTVAHPTAMSAPSAYQTGNTVPLHVRCRYVAYT